MTYGRKCSKKDDGGTAYHTKMDIAGGAYGIKTGSWDGKTVSAAPCPCYEDCTGNGRHCDSQVVRGV